MAWRWPRRKRALPYLGEWGQTGQVMLVVTQIARDGSMRRRKPGTAGLSDARIWEDLIGQVLAAPPPYRPVPGSSIYQIRARDRAVLIAESGLTGPLRELVAAVLASGDPA